MGKVEKLPESLIRLIAAGEVIERPASVMKELVENSLDAGAKNIEIDVWGAGRTRIRISDDGDGMTREDAELALERHATSKLRQFEDLYQLQTFGFRGEALPSIAAISRMTVTTRHESEPQGWTFKLEGGALLSTTAAGVPRGTAMDVQDLFFNTPARSKFLKKDSTERSHLLRTLEEISLAHPDVRFDFNFDGKSLLSLPPAKTLASRVADLWSKTVSDNLITLESQLGPCKLRGLVSKPTTHHPTKAYQVLFVNNRPISNRALAFSIYDAYREWLPVGRHPVYALFIALDGEQVDVNVHPAKREVRFSDDRAVQSAVYSAIRQAFATSAPFPVPSQEIQIATWMQMPTPMVSDHSLVFGSDLLSDGTASSQPLPADPPALSSFFDDLRFFGQFHRLYLLFEQAGELVMMDQHAADERVHYEQLLAQAAKGQVIRQTLLTPVLWEVSAASAEIVSSYLPELQAMGFGLEAFGSNTFALKELPGSLSRMGQVKRFLDELLEAFAEERPTDRVRIQHEIAARAACRAAIMAGDPVSSSEALYLYQKLQGCERPMTCPHGRPTVIRTPANELNRRFGRPA